MHLLTMSEGIVHLGEVVAVIALGGYALGYDLFFLHSLTCLVYVCMSCKMPEAPICKVSDL